MYYFGFGVGHGIDTYKKTGAKGFKLSDGTVIEEHKYNSLIAEQLILLTNRDKRLKAVIPQYPNSSDVSLKKRASIINAAHKKNPIGIYYSLHMDYNKNHNIRGWGDYKWYKSSQGKKAAKILRDNKKMMPIPYKWSWDCKPNHWTNFYIVRETNCPVVLLENGFFSNAKDRKVVRERCKDIAYWIYYSTCEFFGIKALKKIESNYDWAKPYYNNIKDIIKATRADFNEPLTRASAFVFFSNLYDHMKREQNKLEDRLIRIEKYKLIQLEKRMNDIFEQIRKDINDINEYNVDDIIRAIRERLNNLGL